MFLQGGQIDTIPIRELGSKVVGRPGTRVTEKGGEREKRS